MKLIIGLGNKGEKFAGMYHNVGFMVVDNLAKKLNLKWKWQECLSDVAKTSINGEQIILAKPVTFMNESGKALVQFLKKYQELDLTKDVIVCYDDLDILPGHLRIKENGSAGTHNGIKSIINEAESQQFRRIRVGIGEKPEQVPLADFVLSKVRPDSLVFTAVEDASNELLNYINGKYDFSSMMLQVNTRYNAK